MQRRWRWAVIRFGSIWGIAAGLLIAGAPLGNAQDVPRHDLTVLIYVSDVGPAAVALGYAGTVDHGLLAAAFRELAERTGARITDVEIEDGPPARGLAGVSTAAQFMAQGLVRRESGMLPVGPLVRSLPGWERMRLTFIVGEGFRFLGPQSASADGYRVRLVSAMKPYEYDVERMSEAVAPRPATMEPAPVPPPVLPAALVGLPAGFVVGWLLGERPRGRSGGRTTTGPGSRPGRPAARPSGGG